MNRTVKPRSAARKSVVAKGKTSLKKSAKTTATKKIRRESPVKKLSVKEIQARTAQRAYEIFEQRGHSHGNDFNDWVEAEKMVLAEV